MEDLVSPRASLLPRNITHITIITAWLLEIVTKYLRACVTTKSLGFANSGSPPTDDKWGGYLGTDTSFGVMTAIKTVFVLVITTTVTDYLGTYYWNSGFGGTKIGNHLIHFLDTWERFDLCIRIIMHTKHFQSTFNTHDVSKFDSLTASWGWLLYCFNVT
jgi:hypothetical protein